MLFFSNNFTEKDNAVVQANTKKYEVFERQRLFIQLLFLFCEAYWVSPSVSSAANYESWMGTIGWPSMNKASQITSEIFGSISKVPKQLIGHDMLGDIVNKFKATSKSMKTV